MSIAEKLTTIAENEQKVFKAGKQAVYKEMFDAYQKNGTRTNYAYAFQRWEEPMFYPTHDIKPEGSNSYIFNYFGENIDEVLNLKERLTECGVVLDTSKATSLANMFYYARISHIPTIDITGLTGDAVGVFASRWLESIEKIIIKADGTSTFRSLFTNSEKLKDLRIEGVIGVTFGLTSSPINAESAISIINALKNYSGTENEFVYTVSFSSTTKGYLEALGETAPNGMTWLMYAQSKGWNT